MKSNLPAATAKNINDAHRCAQESAENAVEWAVRCGDLLIAKQDEMGHGRFYGWIESDCDFALSTAKRYIAAAKKKATGVAISSLSGIFPSGQPGAKKSDTPKGAVSVVKPKGTEETGADRPAASASPPERASQPPGAEIRPGARPTQIVEDDAPERPSEEEFAAIDREIQESESRVLRADTVTAGYHDELKRQAAEIAVLKTTRDGYMRGKDSVTKLLQAEQRKVAKLEKENKSLREQLAAMEGKAA
jgi:hypothetical protein